MSQKENRGDLKCQIGFTIEEELYHKIVNYALEQDRSLSQVVRNIIKEYFAKIKTEG